MICAAAQFVDKGKVALIVPAEVEAAATWALDVPPTLQRESEQRKKDARKADRATQRARDDANQTQKKISIKDAVFEVLPEAKTAAGSTVGARTLYYKVRPLVQKLTDADLDYAYFSRPSCPSMSAPSRRCPACTTSHEGRCTTPTTTGASRWYSEVEAYTPPGLAVRQGALHREDRLTGPTGALPARAALRHGDHLRERVFTGCMPEPVGALGYPRHEVVRSARRRPGRVQHRPHPRGSDPAHAGSHHRRHRLGVDGAAGHRDRAGDREVHPPQGTAGRSGTRRGCARMVHPRNGIHRLQQGSLSAHAAN